MSELVVVDASVAVKWFIPESGSVYAVRLLDGSRTLAAPDFMLLEIDNVVCKLIRRGSVTKAKGAEMRADMRNLPIEYHPFGPLQEQAYALANHTRRSLYDCLYLALAVALDGPLATADRPFYDEVRQRAPELKLCWIEAL